MDVSIEKYIERLTGILVKKIGRLQEILRLTEVQSSVINEDSIDALQKLIDQKQLIIDDINSLDDEFTVYFNRIKASQKCSSLDELNTAGVSGIGELKRHTEEILRLITVIGEVEKANNEKSKILLNQLGGELKKISQGKKVNSAYSSGQIKAPSYFIDKKK